MRRKTAFLTAVLVVFAVAAQATSSRIESLAMSATGKGTIEITGQRTKPVSSLALDLKKGGSASISLRGDQTWKFGGRWWMKSGSILGVRVTSTPGGKPAQGTASIGLREQNSLDQMSIHAQSGKTTYRVGFKATKSWPTGSSASYSGLNQTASGYGTLTMGSETAKLTRCSVELKSTGQSTLRTYGNTSRTFGGRWSVAKKNEVDMVVNSSVPKSNISAKGKLYLRDDSTVDRIRIPGRVDNKTFLIEFKAR